MSWGEYQSQAAAAGGRVRPLTHRNLEGAAYQRLPDVERQIVAALCLGPGQLLARAQIRDTAADGYLSEECLVYLIRHHHRLGSPGMMNGLAEILLRRCAGWIQRQLKSLRPPHASDGYDDVIDQLFGQILDLSSDRGDFLQVRFWLALKKLTIHAFERQIRETREEQASVRIETLTGDDGDDEDGDHRFRRARRVDGLATPPADAFAINRDVIRDALSRLRSPEHRSAFLLRHYAGWPIEDQDPTVRTISRHFQKDPRTIRNWLAGAEQSLSAWRGEQQ